MTKLSTGVLAQTFSEAMRIWDAQKAAGASRAERLRGLEATLRTAWPQTREWKYLCQRCNDYGLEMFECPGDATCGRARPHQPHDCGRPCWCSAGARFREKPRHDDDHTAAGAVTKRRPTRIGR